jgi:hypothetical protein
MNKKIIVFLVLMAIFVPQISFSAVPPVAFLNIIVNTQGQDAIFHYDLNEGHSGFIDITTEEFYGSGIEILTPDGGSYSLSQANTAGFKVDSIFCTSDNLNDVFFYQPSSVIFTPKKGESITCIFNNIQSVSKNPVLIVPGLTGTEMKKGNELFWADLGRMLADIGDEFMDPLSFAENLAPIDSAIYITSVIKKLETDMGLIQFDYADGLINEFVGQDYAENEMLFTFPYDWRYGVSGKFEDGTTVTDLLAQKIQDILQQTGASKVDVVAHSMGGLLVKQYVMENPSSHNIGKAIFVGVPNTGAPKAVKGLLQGDNFGIPWLADAEIKKISENMPSAYDLLPSQKYYDIKGSFIKTIEEVNLTTENPTQQNIVNDLDYQETKSFLTNDHSLNSLALAGAENLHTQSFDNFDARTAGVDVYNLVGCKAATLEKIIEIKRNSFLGSSIEYRNLKFTTGDGTVPFESATNLPVDQANKYYALSSSHGKMLSQNGIRQEIVNLVSGSELTVLDSLVTQDINQCQLNGEVIEVYSPVDVTVTDQSGNKLGLADDKSLVNEIPNADFEIWGEHKFVFLPTDSGQIYDININGTDSGIFTIRTQNILNNQTGGTEVFSNISVTDQLVGKINLADETVTLSLDTDGNGTIDEVLQPSSVVGSEESEDFLPPTSTATIIGEQGDPNFYRLPVSVKISAVDDNSGVLALEYNLDDMGYQKVLGDTAVINVSDEGEHTIKFFSTDKAGNNETEKSITFTIDKTPPEVAIEFDSSVKNLKFTGIDDSLVTVVDNDNIITLTDQAGNVTELTLKDKNRKIFMKAEIKSLKYNDVLANINKNFMKFLWTYDKKQNLKMLSQHVKSKNGYNILAIYNGKKTTFVGKDAKGLILKSFNGLKIIKVTTNKGDLIWNY